MFCRIKFDIIFLLSQCKTTNFSVFLFSFSFVNGNRICLQFRTLYLFVVLVILDICKGRYMTDGSSRVPPLLNLRVLKNSSYISGLSSVPDVESHTHTHTRALVYGYFMRLANRGNVIPMMPYILYMVYGVACVTSPRVR